MASHVITNFSGMNRGVTDVLCDKSEFRLLMNWNTGSVGALAKVPGVTQLGTTIAASPVESIFEHVWITGGATTRVPMCTVSSTAYYWSGSAWTSASGYSPVVGEYTSWATIDNKLFATCATRGEYVSTNGGQSFTALSASTSKHKYNIQYGNFLWGGGLSANPPQIDKSEIGGSTAWDVNPFNATTVDYETVEDAVVGLASQNDQLLIPMASGRIARFNLATMRTFATNVHGVGHRNMAATDYFMFLRSLEDLYVYVGESLQSIGKRVKDVLRGSNSTIGTAYQRTYNCYLGDLTIDGYTYSKCLLTYDTDNDNFYLRNDLDIQSACQIVLSGKEYYLFGNSSGKTYYIDPAATQNASGTAAITATAVSVPQYITKPDDIKSFGDVFVVSNQGEGTIMDVRVDLTGNWINLGQLQERFTLFQDPPIPDGRCLEYRFTNTSDGTVPEISYIKFDYEVTRAKH